MVSSFDYLSGTSRYAKQEVVVQQSASRQTVSETAIMTGGTFERSFWMQVLAEKGLESPGREEAVRRTMEKVAEKKRVQEAKLALKGKKGRKKK
jgi:hypothetical protein